MNFVGIKFTDSEGQEFMASMYPSPKTGEQCFALAPIGEDGVAKRCACWENELDALRWLNGTFPNRKSTEIQVADMMFTWRIVSMKPKGSA